MNTKKLFCLLLCLMLTLPVFFGCRLDANVGDNTSEVSDTSEVTGSDTQADPDFLQVVTGGVAVDIVFAQPASSGELAFVNDLTDTLYKLGCTEVVARDETEVYDPTRVEIVIGKTSYAESRSVFDVLCYGQGTICVSGNKLIVAAFDEDIYSSLSPKIALALKNGKDEQGNIKIARDYSISTSKNALVSSLPVLQGLPLNDVKDGGDNSYVLTFRNASVTDLNGYADILKQNGYEEYAKNTIDTNTYYTLINDDNVITLMLTDYNDELRVIVEKRSGTSLPTRENENVWTPVDGISTTITQIGLLSENASGESRYNGLSFVIRLADGSFIVIDGGHDNGNDHDKLYKILEKQSEGRKIVIAAWFFTHDHGDHTGFFKSFCEKYASNVTVEQFVYNFPAVTDVKDGTGKVGGNIRMYFRSSAVVKAHPGQQFFIRNAKIDLLYTNDLWEHKKQVLKTHNEASLVFTVELEGKKLIILGDYYDDSGILRNLYTAETLKSDIMQVSHHGISNCGSLLYPIIAPEWALWPLGDDHWISESEDRYISDHPINAYMKSMDQNKVFMAKDDIVILTVKDGNITSQIFENDAIYLAS